MAATNGQAAKSANDTDLADLKEQYDILKIEMQAMADMIGSTAQNKAETARDEALARMEIMGSEARAKVGSLQADAERAVTSNPLMTVAAAAGIGFLIGALTRR